MNSNHHFLIIDGYPKKSRDEFDEAGMKPAAVLYEEMLKRHAPNAKCDIIFPSDTNSKPPAELDTYDGVLWTGCNLTVYRMDDENVLRMREIALHYFEKGIPSFGSCWAAQIAVAIAGGEVKLHPNGREIGIARQIVLTPEGQAHPMYKNKPSVFDAFISHDDEITRLPPHSKCLAGNSWSNVQAIEVNYKKGTFWAPQYHPEYNLYEMARLFIARKSKMLKWGFFRSEEDLNSLVQDFESLWKDRARKDLIWKLGIRDDLMDEKIKEIEFSNWLNHFFKE